MEKYRVAQSNDGSWGIYLGTYNVRIAGFCQGVSKKTMDEIHNIFQLVGLTAKKRRKPMRSGGRPALDREELLKKAKAMGIFVPEETSTLRLDSYITRAEADQILRKKTKKNEFYGPCLPGRKRHYFGRDTGWAGGMGQPWTYRCGWCGKYNPKWKVKFWEEEAKETK